MTEAAWKAKGGTKMKYPTECHLCFVLCEHEATTPLNLYLIGSEGIRVCFRCRKALTDVASIIRDSNMRKETI